MTDAELDLTSSFDGALRGVVAVIVAGENYRRAAALHFDLSVAGTHALTYLDAHGPMSQTALARWMGLTSGGVTNLVDRLERSGIVRRGVDPQDRRRHRVELTDLARRVILDGNEGLVRAFDGIDRDALRVLAETLPLIGAALAREAAGLEQHDHEPFGPS